MGAAGRGAVMASADGLGWPEESRQPAAAPAAHRSRAESSGLGWPRGDLGRGPGHIRQAGAEKERVTVAQAADERAEDEPPTRVRQALSAAVSRETEDRAPAGGAAGEGPGGGPPAGSAGQAAAAAPAGPGTADTAAGQIGAPAAVAPGPGRPATSPAEAALAALG